MQRKKMRFIPFDDVWDLKVELDKTYDRVDELERLLQESENEVFVSNVSNKNTIRILEELNSELLRELDRSWWRRLLGIE